MDLGYGIRDPGSGTIPDPGSRGQKGTGSRIRIRNTEGNHGACDTVPLLFQEKLLPRVLLANRHENFHREIMELVTLSLYCFGRSCSQGSCWPTGVRPSTGKSWSL